MVACLIASISFCIVSCMTFSWPDVNEFLTFCGLRQHNSCIVCPYTTLLLYTFVWPFLLDELCAYKKSILCIKHYNTYLKGHEFGLCCLGTSCVIGSKRIVHTTYQSLYMTSHKLYYGFWVVCVYSYLHVFIYVCVVSV